MNAHALESLYHRLGQPSWFWPAVMFVIFIALPCLASAIDGALQP